MELKSCVESFGHVEAWNVNFAEAAPETRCSCRLKGTVLTAQRPQLYCSFLICKTFSEGTKYNIPLRETTRNNIYCYFGDIWKVLQPLPRQISNSHSAFWLVFFSFFWHVNLNIGSISHTFLSIPQFYTNGQHWLDAELNRWSHASFIGICKSDAAYFALNAN